MSRNDNNDNIMEALVEELSFQIPFKETTETGDTVIMLRENDDQRISPVYAKVMGFDRDRSKRDEWWHVHFVFLEVPPLPRTIILQTPHFTGQEVFTMGGRKVFIKAINFSAFADEMMISQPEDLKSNDSSDGDAQAAKGKKQPQSEKKPTFTLIK